MKRSSLSLGRVPVPLLFAVFLDLVGFGAILPDIQTRLEAFGAVGWQIGLVLSSYSAVQIAVSPFWGRYSDRVGRKRVLVYCGLLSALSLVAYGLAHSLPWILLSRILAGFAAANVAAAQAYVSDTLSQTDEPNEEKDHEEAAAAQGRISSAVTVGLILGPALGGWLASVGGNGLLGFCAAGASGLGALWIAVAVPDIPAPPKVPQPESEHKRSEFASLLHAAPALRLIFVLAFSAMLALAFLEGTFGRLIRHNLGLGPREFGIIFAFESVLGVLVQSVLLGPLTARSHPRFLLACAYVMQGAGLGLTPLAPNLPVLFCCSALYAVGVGIASPTLSALAGRAAPAGRSGEVFGLMQSSRSAGFLVGPTVGGSLFDWSPASPYFLAGVVSAVAAVVAATGRSLLPPEVPEVDEPLAPASDSQ